MTLTRIAKAGKDNNTLAKRKFTGKNEYKASIGGASVAAISAKVAKVRAPTKKYEPIKK